MLAVIKTGGKQYLVKEGDKIKIEKLGEKEGAKVIIKEVFLVDDRLGAPLVEGAEVEAKILKQGRGKKIRVVKYKPKIRYKKETGHRQHYTEIQITKISV